jgi:hypothetical protein
MIPIQRVEQTQNGGILNDSHLITHSNEDNSVNKNKPLIPTEDSSKKYPFIKGWKFTDNYKEYEVITLIDLYMDFNILSDYLNIPLDPYWKIRLKDPNNNYNTTYSIGTLLTTKSPSQNSDMHIFRTKIDNHHKNTYSYIPDELKRFYTYESEYGNPDKLYLTQPTVHNFIVYNE